TRRAAFQPAGIADELEGRRPSQAWTPNFLRLPASFAKKRDRGGIAVQITRVADRADFAVAEKSGARDRAKNIGECRRIVIGHAEKALAASVAGKNERGKRLAAFEAIQLCEFHQILVGGGLVAQLVLQGLPGSDPRTDRDCARLGIGAEQVADEKIAALQ